MTTLRLRSPLCSLLITVGPALACQVPMAVGDGYGEGSGGGDGGGTIEGGTPDGGTTTTDPDATSSAPTTTDEPPGTEGSTSSGGATSGTEGSTSSGGGTTDAVSDSGTVTTGAVGGSEGETTDGEPLPIGCGDGIVDEGEECDDGNLDGYDGCETTCQRTIAEAVLAWNRTCIRTIHGDVKCWGFGSATGNQTNELLGDDETPASLGFVDLGAPAIDIASDAAFNCAVLDTGAIRCFGSNLDGRLGIGVMTTVGDDEPPSAYPPIDFGDLGGASFVQVSVSTCGLLDTGGVRCWGPHVGLGVGAGAIGTGYVGDDETPAEAGYGDVPVGLPVTELFGQTNVQVVRTLTGSLRAWGYFSHALARGDATGPIGGAPTDPTIIEVGDLPFDGIEMTNIDFGLLVSCSVQGDGTVYCWGSASGFWTPGALGLPGILGVGGAGQPTILEAGPVDVGGPVAFLESAESTVCAVLVDGTMRCWGHSAFGALARGNTDPIGYLQPPSVGDAVDLGGRVVAFADAMSARHHCVLLESGELKCWGYNLHGQLGYGHGEHLGDDPGEVGPALPAVQVF